MYVCMYICMYKYMYICIHTYIHSTLDVSALATCSPPFLAPGGETTYVSSLSCRERKREKTTEERERGHNR